AVERREPGSRRGETIGTDSRTDVHGCEIEEPVPGAQREPVADLVGEPDARCEVAVRRTPLGPVVLTDEDQPAAQVREPDLRPQRVCRGRIEVVEPVETLRAPGLDLVAQTVVDR